MKRPFKPDSASPPGETLRDILLDRGMSQAELAYRLQRPQKTISEIVHGKCRISERTAIELEDELGVSAEFWLTREWRYRLFLARKSG